MAIFKINKNKDYTVMSNYHLKEKEMSLKAKGLLSQMLSLPEKWDYSINGLVAINKENETSIKNTLKELQDFNYLKVTKLLPNETKTGRIEYTYDIYEQPYKKQEVEKQGVENLGVEFLGVENQGQLNTNNKITNKLNINNNISSSSNKINKESFEYFEFQFGRTLAPIEYEKINLWKKTYNDDIIKYAIDIAVLKNKKSFSYIEGILKNWKTAGYKTLREIKENEIKEKEETKEELFSYNWLEEE